MDAGQGRGADRAEGPAGCQGAGRAGQGADGDPACLRCICPALLAARNPASLQEGTLVLISLGGVSLGLGETELLAAVSYCVSECW